MLQSSHRAGSSPMRDIAQPFGSQIPSSRDGGNVVQNLPTVRWRLQANFKQHIEYAPALLWVGIQSIVDLRVDARLKPRGLHAGDHHPQEASLPWP